MNNILSHHGIKGQKWGVRRYQNQNGSLTSRGKSRYYRVSDKDEKKQKSMSYVTSSKKDIEAYSNMIKTLKGSNEFYVLEFEGTVKIASIKEGSAIFNRLKSNNDKFKRMLAEPYGDFNRNKYKDYSSSLADRDPRHSVFLDAVRSAGYDGLVDYNDYRITKKPIIIISPEKLKKIGSSKRNYQGGK